MSFLVAFTIIKEMVKEYILTSQDRLLWYFQPTFLFFLSSNSSNDLFLHIKHLAQMVYYCVVHSNKPMCLNASNIFEMIFQKQLFFLATHWVVIFLAPHLPRWMLNMIFPNYYTYLLPIDRLQALWRYTFVFLLLHHCCLRE